MLELYTHPQSPCAQKVKIVSAEKGLAWTKHYVNLSEKENLRSEYRKLNQIPTICPPAVATAIPEIAETTSENNLPCPCIREIQPDGV
jgi:glutathione S-transferase